MAADEAEDDGVSEITMIEELTFVFFDFICVTDRYLIVLGIPASLSIPSPVQRINSKHTELHEYRMRNTTLIKTPENLLYMRCEPKS